MEDAADERPDAGDQPADERPSASGQLARVREAFRVGHRDSCADRHRQPGHERGVRLMRVERDSEVGARVDREPSISPTIAGWTRWSRKTSCVTSRVHKMKCKLLEHKAVLTNERRVP